MTMTEKVIRRQVWDKTIATVTFDDGTVTELESGFEDSQGGRGYDGGHWGPFPNFRDFVEGEVKAAQQKWAKPAATIRYERVTETVETVERTTTKRKFYTERRATP